MLVDLSLCSLDAELALNIWLRRFVCVEMFCVDVSSELLGWLMQGVDGRGGGDGESEISSSCFEGGPGVARC